jgi:putative membrane protein
MGTMMGWYGDGMGWGGWIAMTLAMVVFWTVVVLAVVAIFRGTGDARGPRAEVRPGPLEILEERFARGEIDVDEYRARHDVLRDAQRR